MPWPRESSTKQIDGPGPSTVPVTATQFGQAWQTVLSFVVFMLLCVRFYLPAEAAVQGDTLWIVALWIACTTIWLAGIQWGAFPTFRFDWIDAALALWIGSQVVSTLFLVLTEGDKRAAVNVCWEWLGVGMTWLLLRHAICDVSIRLALIRVVIVSGTVVAGLGLHQHYISQPQMVAEYGPLFDRLREGTADSIFARQKLSNAGIPTEGPALTLFEKRLRDSREPLGLFALANTLGGCLAVCLILAIGQISSQRRLGSTWTSLLPLLLAAAVIGWCLLLTKSRTAWIGTIVGCSILLLPKLRFLQQHRKPIFLGIGICVIMAGLVARFGGLDRQVLSEAPKSLSYRLQYWRATTRMIADHFWLGVGPGNFRQYYLMYKLPEASEEISDPHNMLFEVAATGGVMSLVGMIAFFGLVSGGFLRQSHCDTASKRLDGSGQSGKGSEPIPSVGESTRASRAFWGGAVGAPFAFASLLIFDGDWEDRLLVLSVLWVALGFWVGRLDHGQRRASSVNDELTDPGFAAFSALAVHLLGAGGIAMPGITQWLMALAAVSLGGRSNLPMASPNTMFKVAAVAASEIGLMVMGIELCRTALIPVMRVKWLMNQGEVAARTRSRGLAVTKELYLQATLIDAWSPEPWRRLFELNSPGENQSNESFEVSVKDLREYMVRDPKNFWGPRNLGRIYLSRSGIGRRPSDSENAVAWLRLAHQLYPTNSEILAELSSALGVAGERWEAIEMARRAINQDEVYRKHGHVDRYLSDEILIRLRRVVADGGGKYESRTRKSRTAP